MTKNLAKALAPEVRVNAVAPAAVESAWQINWTEEQRAGQAKGTLLKRIAKAEEVGDLIVYLGFGATYVTGQTVTVDGGLTLA
jgi:3-oxoacyl-[acyl-carrier protein] reductase